MTVREIIAIITHDYSKGTPGDDSALRPRRVYAALKNARAATLSRVKKLHDNNYVTLPCVPIVEVSQNECPCVPVLGCKNYVTDCQLPIPIGDNMPVEISTYDGSIRFSQIDFSELTYLSANRYTANTPKFYIRNRKAYLLNAPKRLELVTVRLLSEDPTDLACVKCGSNDTLSCNPLDAPFPLDREYASDVIRRAAFELFKFQTYKDVYNNQRDDTNGGTPAQAAQA